MEEELRKIDTTFQSGKHKQAIAEIQKVIETLTTDDRIYKAYDILGDYQNFMGEHVEAVAAWTNALKLLEETPGGLDNLNEEKLIDWMNISLATAQVLHRQGSDGPGVSHKYNGVCYTVSNISESEKTEWTKKQFETAIKHYRAVIEKIPENDIEMKRKVRTGLARVLYDNENFDEAVKIYADAFNNDGDPEWLYKAAACSWQQGNKEQTYIRLQQLIATEPTFVKAYKLCATYFTEKNDTVKADEYTLKYQFYSWIPGFCQHIEYNPENISIFQAITSDQAVECVQTTLGTDMSQRSTEFLAAICYHHYHGPVENKAFEELEKRGKASEGVERDFIGSILMYLIRKNQSVCTIKGAASALAGMKYDQAFEVLANLLPQDLDLSFPMDIPMALAKLGDPQAVPFLIRIIEEPIPVENYESDSSDDLFQYGGSDRLLVQSCIALSTFFTEERVKEVLYKGLNNELIREICLAVLGVCTGEKQYLDEVEKILAEGNTPNYMVVQYLANHVDKSEQIEKFLKLNADILMKKKQKVTSDDDYKD